MSFVAKDSRKSRNSTKEKRERERARDERGLR